MEFSLVSLSFHRNESADNIGVVGSAVWRSGLKKTHYESTDIVAQEQTINEVKEKSL